MIKFTKSFAALGAAILLGAAGLAGEALAQAPATGAQLKVVPAARNAAAAQAGMLGAALAGDRVVAVGDYGTVILSDDKGKNFRQAGAVPLSATLTAVSFADDKQGWVVGHWGSILHTADGGETWAIQRLDTAEDRPLFSVHFFDARQGIAVGLWSLVLLTKDGGQTWETVNLPAPPEGGKADRNLFKAFANVKGSLFVVAERGTILRTDDRGQTWKYVNTGYKGSFWSGLALKNGVLLAAGLRGTIYRSDDDGSSWHPVFSGTKSSITDLIEWGSKVVAVGLDGVQLESVDSGLTFTASQREDRLSLTAIAAASATTLVRFSKKGVVAEGAASPKQ